MGKVSRELKEQDRNVLLARIPAFPPIVLRLLNLLASDDVEIRDLVALISSDPAFSAQLLRVANSPLFGFRAQIDMGPDQHVGEVPRLARRQGVNLGQGGLGFRRRHHLGQ